MREPATPRSASLTGRGAVRAAASAVSTTTVTVLPVFLVGGLAVQIGNELGFSPAGLGLVVALYFGVSALSSLPSGWLVERYGPRPTSRAAILLASGAMAATGLLAQSYLALVLTLAFSASANALGQLSSNATLARHVPPHRLGLTFGIKQAAIPLATLLAGAAVPAIALTVGWRWAFLLGAALGVSALALAPRGSLPRPETPAGGATAERANSALVVVAAGAALAAGAATALGVFLVDSAVNRGIDAAVAGTILTLGSVVALTARLLWGWLADRRGGGHLIVVAGLLASGSGGVALLAAPGVPLLVIGTVIGFGLGWSWPGMLQFAVVRLHPSTPAAATSITQSGVYVGGCLGPLGFGLVADRSYAAAWLAAAAAMLAAAALIMFGRRMLRAHAAARAPAPH
jgi:MFS family permease